MIRRDVGTRAGGERERQIAHLFLQLRRGRLLRLLSCRFFVRRLLTGGRSLSLALPAAVFFVGCCCGSGGGRAGAVLAVRRQGGSHTRCGGRGDRQGQGKEEYSTSMTLLSPHLALWRVYVDDAQARFYVVAWFVLLDYVRGWWVSHRATCHVWWSVTVPHDA